MDVTESELLEVIRRLLAEPADDVVIGIGDDAAVVRPGSGELILTTDALVQARHFELGSVAPRDLGAKSIVVSVSDVAAMAGSPRFALAALTLSDRVDAAWTVELLSGMREACDEYGLRLVGGNLAGSATVTITTTVSGEVAPGRAVGRGGARPGDRVVVTGELGGAAAGLRLGRRRGGWTGPELAAIRRHIRPVARVGEAAVLARHGATSMIDVSDGFGRDVGRICAASGVAARIRVPDVPVAEAATTADALGGGEDYELVATMPGVEAVAAAAEELREVFGTALTDVGAIAEGEGVAAEGSDAFDRLERVGWEHLGP